MLTIIFKISDIDYDRTVDSLASARLPEDLAAQLGPDPAGKLRNKLRGLDADGRDALLVSLVSANEPRLRSEANRALENWLGAGAVTIGGILAEDVPGSGLNLTATGVEADFNALADSRPVASSGLIGGALKIAIGIMTPAALETTAARLLSSDGVKPQLIEKLGEALKSAGLYVTVSDIEAKAG